MHLVGWPRGGCKANETKRRRKALKSSAGDGGDGHFLSQRDWTLLGGDILAGRPASLCGKRSKGGVPAPGEAEDTAGIVSDGHGPICSAVWVHTSREGEQAGFPFCGAGFRVNN